MKESAPEMNASSSEAEEEKEDQPKMDGEKDPDFSQVSSSHCIKHHTQKSRQR